MAEKFFALLVNENLRRDELDAINSGRAWVFPDIIKNNLDLSFKLLSDLPHNWLHGAAREAAVSSKFNEGYLEFREIQVKLANDNEVILV